MKKKTRHPLNHAFNGMKQRCLNPNNPSYKRYGGRGIKICDRWLGREGFKNFVSDVGERPNGHQLDRIDNDGNYEPSNVRWATQKTQNNNRVDNVPFSVDWMRQRGKWRLRFRENYLGLFETKKLAVNYGYKQLHFSGDDGSQEDIEVK
jgi:hypothetical protein